MSNRQIIMENAGQDLYTAIQQACVAYGSEVRDDRGRPSIPDFYGASISALGIKFDCVGKAAEFMQTPAAKELVEQHGFLIAVMRESQIGNGVIDGKQQYRLNLNVRLEHANDLDEVYEWEWPKELYHVTPSENVPLIMEHGLSPKDSSRPEFHNYRNRLHLATTCSALELITRVFVKYDKEHGLDRKYSVFQIDLSGVHHLFKDPEFRGRGVVTKDTIPPNALKIISDDAELDFGKSAPDFWV